MENTILSARQLNLYYGENHALKDICIQIPEHQITALTLTLKEFQVLCLLMERAGTVFTRDQLLNTIWGYEFDGASRTVDVHIRTLRQKLGRSGDCIETVRGVGYKVSTDTRTESVRGE